MDNVDDTKSRCVIIEDPFKSKVVFCLFVCLFIFWFRVLFSAAFRAELILESEALHRGALVGRAGCICRVNNSFSEQTYSFTLKRQ